MILKRASTKAIVYSCKNYHYSKKPPVLNGFSFSVFNKNNEFCGCIVYGYGGNYRIGNKYGLKQGQVLELVRMALNGKQSSTSKALSLSLKLLKKKAPSVKLVVSYADKGQNHIGIIYQATNWIYETQNESSTTEYLINNIWLHSRSANMIIKRKNLNRASIKKRKASGKIKYLYPLNKDLRVKLLKISKKYPKRICDGGVNRSTTSFHGVGEGAVPISSRNNYA